MTTSAPTTTGPEPGVFTSPHIERIATAVADGAHVVVLGHIGDVVVWRGRPMTEAMAIAAELERVAGTELVAIADAADGLGPLDPEHRDALERAIAGGNGAGDAGRPPGDVVLPNTPALGGTGGARLGSPSGVDVARGIRRLLVQRERSAVAMLRDVDLLLETTSPTGRQAVATLRRAMEEATCVPTRGPVEHRNALIILAGCRVPEIQDGSRDVVEVRAETPGERALAHLARARSAGFHTPPTSAGTGDENGESFSRVARHDGAHVVERARRASHAVQTGLDEPVRLARLARARIRNGQAFEDLDLQALEAQLRSDIAGQPHAITRFVRALHDARGGNRQRPVAEAFWAPRLVVVLSGPPGVGKTEFLRALQRAISGNPEDMIRIDCATELTQEHSIARLVGADPGYVGYGDGGLLDALAANPARVVLWDELDKIHPRPAGSLLAILEDGRLRTGDGHRVDFSQSIFAFTSNYGSKELRELMRDPAGAPPTDRFLELSTRLIEQGICAIPQAGEPLWSRVRSRVIPFDMMRRPALAGLIAPLVRNMCVSIRADYRVSVTVDEPSVVAFLENELPTDGHWDGRTVCDRSGKFEERFTRPLVDRVRELPARSRAHAWLISDGELGLDVAHPD